MRRPAVIVTCAAAATVLAVVPAQAREYTSSYRTSGDVVVTWSGPGPARGSVVYSPSRSGTVSADEEGEGTSSSSSGFAGPPVIRVVREVADGLPASCVDLAGREGFQAPTLDIASRGAVAIDLTGSMSEGPAASAGRCGGPTAGDLGRLLPRTEVRLRALRAGPRTVDLRTRRSFSAGGVAGSVTSTVTVRFSKARARGARRRRGSRGGDDRFTVLAVGYRVARVQGELATDFRGAADPICAALDACGVAGTAALRLPSSGGRLVLRGAVDPRRARPGSDPARWLRAARRGRLYFFGELELPGRATVAGQVEREGAVECRDSARMAPPRISVDASRRRVRLVMPGVSGARPFANALRNRCPGPGTGLLRRALASGAFPTAQVGAPRIRTALRVTPGGDRVGPYTSARRGAVTLELERAFVRVERFRG